MAWTMATAERSGKERQLSGGSRVRGVGSIGEGAAFHWALGWWLGKAQCRGSH